jgi:hypothetical protein
MNTNRAAAVKELWRNEIFADNYTEIIRKDASARQKTIRKPWSTRNTNNKVVGGGGK